MGEQWKRRPGKAPVLAERNKDGVVYLSFPLLEGCGLVSHGFSTRLGGVSEGELSSMNLGFSRGDDRRGCWKITEESSARWICPWSGWCFLPRPTPPM